MKKKLALALIIGLSLSLAGCENEASDEASDEAAEEAAEEMLSDNTAQKETKTEANETNETSETYSYVTEEYSLVWEDEFENGLNENEWNYELHEPGWVNNELQSYVISDENIYTEDGKLIIKPIKSTDENGNTVYTSGRVNTQGKHDFTYGIFEASIKMPAGQGFLPAFWMMPTDENLYGQWPRCGEIDIAEVVGNDTKTAYSTVHYGNPHSESQGSLTLTEGDFSEEFHTYAVEWLPGQLNWYIDGELIHSENDWYTTTENLGTATYPAPFDQPFYMILNLAVGGDWPGDPNSTTDFETADMEIDYVRVYQKENYDEKVQKPVDEYTLREPDENGNYINNSDFSVEEDLTDKTDWMYYEALEGDGAATIEDNAIKITTNNMGTADYSIQLVHWNLPIEKGFTYRISFDAWGSENRVLKTAVTAPNVGWIRYFEDTEFSISTSPTSYSFEFDMTEETDPEGRLEFNMGNMGSCGDVYISNVKVEKIAEFSTEDTFKNVLADGNYIYNASFREGENHLGSWSVSGPASVEYSVTDLEDSRRLSVNVPCDLTSSWSIYQNNLAMVNGSYVLSFYAQADSENTINVNVNGENIEFNINEKAQKYSYEFTLKDGGADILSFDFKNAGNYLLDDVRIEENTIIKNGNFNAGISSYEVYVDSSADASYVVDSLNEDNALDVTVNKTGSNDWNIQIKQNNITLEKGKTYTLSFRAKCSEEREIRVILQSLEDKDWLVYSGENIVTLSTDYQTFTNTFTMEEDTDKNAFLSICLGAINGNAINSQHRVVIDDISLFEVE